MSIFDAIECGVISSSNQLQLSLYIACREKKKIGTKWQPIL
jgi:hypothetical protein